MLGSDLSIILTASLVAVNCAILGCFLVLRKMSMVGDAISHAVLPGIVIAFFISGSLSSIPVLVGATLTGILCTFLIEWLNKKAGVQADAAIGMIFTFLFAVGVILIAAFASNVHLDQDCVLHGLIEFVPFDLPETGTFLDYAPRQIWILSTLLIFVVALVKRGYRGFFLTSFDPDFAVTTGVSLGLWHYLLMGAVSMTTVVSFESVGAVLVVAFLIIPAAAAYLMTNSLPKMLVLSCIFGVICSIIGYYFAVWVDGNIAGAISVVMGVAFTLVLLFAPERGIVTKKLRKRNLSQLEPA